MRIVPVAIRITWHYCLQKLPPDENHFHHNKTYSHGEEIVSSDASHYRIYFSKLHFVLILINKKRIEPDGKLSE